MIHISEVVIRDGGHTDLQGEPIHLRTYHSVDDILTEYRKLGYQVEEQRGLWHAQALRDWRVFRLEKRGEVYLRAVREARG